MSGNPMFGDVFEGAERDEIAEVVEALAPTSAGPDELKPLPVTQAPRLDANDAAHFVQCETFRQTALCPRESRRPAEVAACACLDYAPCVNPAEENLRDG